MAADAPDRDCRRLLRGLHDAMRELDADKLAELHSPDAVYEFPLPTPGRPRRYVGREEIRAGFRQAWTAAAAHLTVTDVRDVVVHDTTDPDVLVVEHVGAATFIDGGQQVLVPSVLVLEAHGGQLTRVRDYSAGARRPDGEPVWNGPAR